MNPQLKSWGFFVFQLFLLFVQPGTARVQGQIPNKIYDLKKVIYIFIKSIDN